MSMFRNNSSKKPWWIVLLGLLASLTLTVIGSIGGSTAAQASGTGPSISVSGKGCPKASSSWKRHMHISDKAKAGSKICTIKTNDGSYGADLNATYKFTKANDYRFNVAIAITPYVSAHHVSRDGMY